MSYRFNITQDANSDSVINPEDNLENYVRFAIGDSIYGTGRTGLTDRGPNNQMPALYFHLVKTPHYDVYEYWLYYPDNDWLNDHEHDWEKYYVYAQDTTPFYVYISSHISFTGYSWCEISHDDSHPLIGVDGGSHGMKTGSEDGVKIRYNGDISANNGTLIYGDGFILPWNIFSNDSGLVNVTTFLQSPDTFYYGDPYYLTNSNEYGDPNPAPWVRPEWDTPPSAPVPDLGPDTAISNGNSIILDAGSGFSSYLWSDGSAAQTLTVNTAGTYYVEVTDNYGCVISDTIIITIIDNIVPEQNSNVPFINIFSDLSGESVYITSENDEMLYIEMRNIYGQVLLNRFVHYSVVIDVSGFCRGIYIIKVIANNNSLVVKKFKD
jgi:hypothetical protein